jgi:glycosyltransferase involved in cell wall biosynthesis
LDARVGEIDVVHAHAYDAAAFSALSNAPVPVVHTLHLPPLDLLVVEAARRSDATIVTVSESNARSWRAARARVDVVIPNGIDVSEVPLGRRRGDHLIFAGRMSPEKGAATAIDVAERTRRGILLVGDIYDEAYFAKEVAPRVRIVPDATRVEDVRGAIYIGPRTRPEVYELLARAAATLLPVEWDEPFGLVAVESLAAGTPVAGYARGGLVDIVQDGTGELVPPGDVAALADAVQRVVGTDPAECRRRAARFSVEAMVSAYEKLLAGLVHQAGQTRR